MLDVHRQIQLIGTDATKSMAPEKDRHLVDIATRVLAEEKGELGITYAGFCLSSLPHRRLSDNQPWERKGPVMTLLIQPGRLYHGSGDKRTHVLHGVPYGSRARLILLYLQTEAMRRKSPSVPMGRSMHDFMCRMGIPHGGKSIRDVEDQANRISACSLTFDWHGSSQTGWNAERFVQSGGLALTRSDPNQPRLWEDCVELSAAFYKALTEHPVPVWSPAIREISNNSMALDIYAWLAYRLHSLSKATPITWVALHSQFGGGYKAVRQFKPRFLENLKLAAAVYPDARIEVEDAGLRLFPSSPPIPERPRIVRA